MSSRHIHRGEIFHLLDDPAEAGAAAVGHLRDGALLVEDGRIAALAAWEDFTPPPDTPVTAHDGLILPGFIDAHVHYPQTDMIASHGKQLLDWLDTYTFPAEQRFVDQAVARDTADFFLDQILAHGVTCAAVFCTVHAGSVEALFEAALARNMRLIAGKVLMDRAAPEALLDGADGGIAESEALIRAWRGRGRLSYAITPRFAVTSSRSQLARAGALADAYPDAYVHTHLAENVAECALAVSKFPEARDYLAIYEAHGLVRPRSIFAHGVHLEAGHFQRLAAGGGAIAFCPGSNLFLGSGLFNLAGARAHGVGVGLGTDVGAGPSFSMLSTMAEAYKVCQLQGQSLDPLSAYYLATLGAARALRLDDRIGNLAPGKEADFIVLDPGATPLLARRMGHARTLAERLFALAILGDDRAIAATYIAGACAHRRVNTRGTHANG